MAIGVFSALYLAFTITFGIALNKWDSNVTGSCYITRGISAPTAEHAYVDKVYLIVTSIFVFFVLFEALPPYWELRFPKRLFQIVLGHREGAVARKLREITEDFEMIVTKLEMAFQLGLHNPLYAKYLPLTTSAYLILGSLRIFWDDTYRDEVSQSKQQNAILLPLVFQYPLHLYFIVTMRRWNADLLVGDSEDTWGFGQILALVLLAPTILECAKAIASKTLVLSHV